MKDSLEKDICTFNELLAKDNTTKTLSFAQEVLDGVHDEYTDILEYFDVIPFKVEGDKFNPLKQTVVKTLPTTDESLFKIVAGSLSFGYERNGRVVSKERVVAYVVEKQKEQEV